MLQSNPRRRHSKEGAGVKNTTEAPNEGTKREYQRRGEGVGSKRHYRSRSRGGGDDDVALREEATARRSGRRRVRRQCGGAEGQDESGICFLILG
jgi:hypothetical protein